eukprot:1142194-Pelagomonas_calceolata.AAC.2
MQRTWTSSCICPHEHQSHTGDIPSSQDAVSTFRVSSQPESANVLYDITSQHDVETSPDASTPAAG